MPKVTVLLTSFNHEKFIKSAIDSVLNQTFSDYELLIVDDNSKDNSFKIIQSYNDPRIIKIKNDRQMGPEHAFEIMLEKGTGEYVAIFHSDDVWDNTKLEKQVQYLDKNKDIGAVFTAVEVIGEDNKPRIDVQDVYTNVFITENKTRFEWLNRFFYLGNCLCHPSVMIRKQLYFDCKMYTNTLAQVPDFYKWVQLLKKTDIHIMPERLTKYRVLNHEKNTSAPTKERRIRAYTENYFLYNSYFELSDSDILNVFPKLNSYVIDGQFVGKFALAKLFLEEGYCNSQKLCAIECLHSLLNGPERHLIEKLYGYGFLQFIEDTKTHDVFNVMQKNVQLATLFYDLGNGINENDCIKESFAFCTTEIEEINLTFNFKRPLNITRLRFDPLDGNKSIIDLISFKVNGVECKNKLKSNINDKIKELLNVTLN